MARSIRTHYFLQENGSANASQYIKQLYVKNSNWHPPPAPINVEDKITEFEKALKVKHNHLTAKHKRINLSNLTPIQAQTLRLLKRNKNIVIKPTDKNLGPAVMDTNDYVDKILKEHLLTNTYKQLTHTEMLNTMTDLKSALTNAIQSNADKLSQAELTFFKRSLTSHFRLPIFYGLPKVHKNPVALRPVVSTTNSLLAIFSTWLDYKMKELLPYVKSYIKNSTEVILDLKDLHIPQNAKLFSADAVSMYTNIETVSGIKAMSDFLEANNAQISPTFPKVLFLQILETVMTRNIFSFSDTFWLQLSGTAMGTPAACNYATITFGQHENSRIFPSYSQHLLYYKRYIDDIFGIWIPPERNNQEAWTNFKEEINNWGNLKWKFEDLSQHTVFLDLSIEIKGSKIQTKTYQKAMNLYLYIPPLSAHPHSCFKGLVTGEMRRYWIQNNPIDFQQLLIKFIDRLRDRGHTLQDIATILEQAAAHLDSNTLHPTTTPAEESSTLYIHTTYHPNGLQRRDFRQLYNEILAPHLNFDHMTVAVARPTNLRDVLTSATLRAPDNLKVQNLIGNLRQSD